MIEISKCRLIKGTPWSNVPHSPLNIYIYIIYTYTYKLSLFTALTTCLDKLFIFVYMKSFQSFFNSYIQVHVRNVHQYLNRVNKEIFYVNLII